MDSEHDQDLAPALVEAALGTRAYGRSLDVRGLTGSTNDDARTAASAGAARGHVVVADAQTRGRGARGRTWISPRGVDVYLSIVERLSIPPDRIAPLTLAVGLGVADAARALASTLEPRVKWPNDVWIGRRKTAGVLVEASSIGGRMDSLTIGIGLGVNRIEFEPEIAESATSLLAEQRRAVPDAAAFDRAVAVAAVLLHVERWVDRFAADGPAPIIAALSERLALRDEQVRCDDIEGRLIGVASSGALRLETSSGIRDVISGTLRPRGG